MKTLNTYRHKWADVLLAHIDGKAVQYKNLERMNSEWKDTKTISGVDEKHLEWRVKPVYPTLGEIAKKAWYSEVGKPPGYKEPWADCASAVATAIKSGEFSE